MGTITVKVGRMPGGINEYALPAGSTVRDALRTAGITLGNDDIRVSGTPATLDTPLQNGSLVILAEKVKGN